MTGPFDYITATQLGLQIDDQQPLVNLDRMRLYRLARVQAQVAHSGCDAVILTNPIFIRYATGVSSCQVFMMHLPSRTAIVTAEGKAVMLDDYVPQHLRAENNVVDDWRPTLGFTDMRAPGHADEVARKWAREIASIVKARTGQDRGRIAIDAPGFYAHEALRAEGFTLSGAEPIMTAAYRIKSPDEVACLNHAVEVAEAGMWQIREALRPGVTENQLLAILHAVNIAAGGEWGEYKLLLSGPRTLPWVQESSHRAVRGGELVAMDSGLVGPFGYGADVSRTFFCPPGRPDARQRELYKIAAENLEHNMALFKPGRSYREVAEGVFKLPKRFLPLRYGCIAHGIGMGDEVPILHWLEDCTPADDAQVLEEGMVLAVESYVGAHDSIEGVKLEDQIVITKDGYRSLSSFPLERELFALDQ